MRDSHFQCTGQKGATFTIPQLTIGIPSRIGPELRDTRLVWLSPYICIHHAHNVSQLVPIPANVNFDASTQALELALGVLSERLKMTCANSSLLDPGSIGETAEALGKVAQALAQVNHLRQQDIMQSTSIP